ncbi:unnamed protein product [Cylicocyclus nassatus]|uniref:Uncharacterized protein n=1 Tax=Cylicocyclus nassatus TaxID=53992 RepID=A0AA36GZR7_CYLNA|nr:unnamed protein product [Cylicocyclus nassatus]
MDEHVASFWINWNGFSNLVVMAVHFGVYALVMKKEKKQLELGRVVNETNEKQALISLMWLVTIFAFTWCTCMLSQAVVSWMPKSELTLFVESYAFIFGMMAYSANYYVYFARNRSYRVVFLEQLGCLLPSKFRNEAILRGVPQSFPTLHATSRKQSMPGPNFQPDNGMPRTTSAVIPRVQNSALARRKLSEEPRRERHPRFY